MPNGLTAVGYSTSYAERLATGSFPATESNETVTKTSDRERFKETLFGLYGSLARTCSIEEISEDTLVSQQV